MIITGIHMCGTEEMAINNFLQKHASTICVLSQIGIDWLAANIKSHSLRRGLQNVNTSKDTQRTASRLLQTLTVEPSPGEQRVFFQ